MKAVTVFSSILLGFHLIAFSQQSVGLFTKNEGSSEGYVLFAPIASTNTYLIDKCGKLINTWISAYKPGLSVYLLPDGTIVRTGQNSNYPTAYWNAGYGGIIEKYDWDNNRLWSYSISDDTFIQHHDICPLPNGNILVVVWERKTSAETIGAGRNSTSFAFNEKIMEIEPYGVDSAIIVWEWNVWDHLVQEFDASKNNFASVREHPELVNINYSSSGNLSGADWLHINAVDYNPVLDQIVLTIHGFSELWVIDHSTTTAEAAGHNGGDSGKGGDILFRWGNPQTYNRGTTDDQKYFLPHNANWIPSGFPGENNIIIFNNGSNRPEGNYSSVETLLPPVDGNWNYSITSEQPFQPSLSSWVYTAPVPTDFFAPIISGAQRLSNGNTLICDGTKGRFFEIDENENTVWKYINPVGQNGAISQGTPPNGNSVFRCTLYEPDYPAFIGKDMTPGSPIELNPTPGPCDVVTSVGNGTSADPEWSVFPNPFSDKISLVSDQDQKNVTLVLSDIAGKAVESKMISELGKNQPYHFNMREDLPPGMYSLSFTSERGFEIVKIVKSVF